MSYKVTFGKVRIECDTFKELQQILDYEASRTTDRSTPGWSSAVREQFKAALPEGPRKLVEALEENPDGIAYSRFPGVLGTGKLHSPGPLFVSIYGGLKKFGVSDPKGLILKERKQGEQYYRLAERYFRDE